MNLKISKWCEILAFKFRQKSLYFELKHYIKNNQTYLRKVRYWERGMGKTYTLVELAHKFNYPIAVSNDRTVMYIKDKCRELKIEDVDIIVCNNSARGKKYKKILCEEGIDIDYMNEVLMPMCECLVGYINPDTYSNKSKFKQEYECNWIG